MTRYSDTQFWRVWLEWSFCLCRTVVQAICMSLRNSCCTMPEQCNIDKRACFKRKVYLFLKSQEADSRQTSSSETGLILMMLNLEPGSIHIVRSEASNMFLSWVGQSATVEQNDFAFLHLSIFSCSNISCKHCLKLWPLAHFLKFLIWSARFENIGSREDSIR